MLLIPNLTADPLQDQTIVLPDGSNLLIELYYRPNQYGWYFNQLVNTSQNFSLNGIRICNSPNMLSQFINLINFGIACDTVGEREPTQQQDFASGAASLYILTQAECQQFQAYLQTEAT